MAINNNALTVDQSTGEIMDFNSGGSAAMAATLVEMEAKLKLVQEFFKRVMVKETDYGIIPGTDKPSLLKPGAEKLLALYNYSSVVKEKTEERDIKTGYYHAQLVIQIVHRGTGVLVAEGVGEASSFESKYRYRWVYENDIPDGIDKNTLLSKTFKSKNTGKNYAKYRLENPDMIDQWNTVLKMAKKRALVDATLNATGTSSLFCQSEGEWDAWIEAEGGKKETFEKQRQAPQSSDERGSFTPPPSTSGGRVTERQLAKIFADAKRKGIEEADMRTIILYVKKQTVEDLSTKDASMVIDFIDKNTSDELQAIVVDAAMGS